MKNHQEAACGIKSTNLQPKKQMLRRPIYLFSAWCGVCDSVQQVFLQGRGVLPREMSTRGEEGKLCSPGPHCRRCLDACPLGSLTSLCPSRHLTYSRGPNSSLRTFQRTTQVSDDCNLHMFVSDPKKKRYFSIKNGFTLKGYALPLIVSR